MEVHPLRGVVGECGFYLIAVSRYRVFGCRIRFDAKSPQLCHAGAAYSFLFAQFEWVHMVKTCFFCYINVQIYGIIPVIESN